LWVAKLRVAVVGNVAVVAGVVVVAVVRKRCHILVTDDSMVGVGLAPTQMVAGCECYGLFSIFLPQQFIHHIKTGRHQPDNNDEHNPGASAIVAAKDRGEFEEG
jgi:hypothetical protein